MPDINYSQTSRPRLLPLSAVRAALLAVSVCVVPTACGWPVFTGFWRGTFHSMPDGTPHEDAGAHETVHPFELRLNEKGGAITGVFRQLDTSAPAETVKNAKRFVGGRICFDLTELDPGFDFEMRWCVSLHHGDLVGQWNKGPQGGPGLGGAGIGVRFFDIKAKRVREE